MLLNVPLPVLCRHGVGDPADEVEDGDAGYEDEPEPEEEEDGFVEEVDGQYALDGVSLEVAQATDAEIAHGDAGEARGIAPACSVSDGPQYVDAVDAEGVAEHGIEDEELTDDIEDVENLAADV